MRRKRRGHPEFRIDVTLFFLFLFDEWNNFEYNLAFSEFFTSFSIKMIGKFRERKKKHIFCWKGCISSVTAGQKSPGGRFLFWQWPTLAQHILKFSVEAATPQHFSTNTHKRKTIFVYIFSYKPYNCRAWRNSKRITHRYHVRE